MFISQEFRGNYQQQGHHKLHERQSGALIDATDIMAFSSHRLRVFLNRVLENIFGPNRDKVTGG
jgi:hypothetical protein